MTTVSPLPDPGERALVERFLRERSDAAFAPLYALCAPRLYGLIARLLGPGSRHVDDVFQDTWVRAIAALPDFRWRSRLATWVCGIAVNACREARRREGRDAGGDDAALDAAPAAPPFDRATRIDLERAIERLAPGYREVLLLHDVQGFTHDEIAALLGIEPGTSKSQLSRARAALRAALAAPSNSPISTTKKESVS